MNGELKSSTISSLFWKFIERGGRAVVELIVQIVMARLLAPDDFGALAIMLVFVNLGNVLVQSGLNTALIQDADVTDDDFSTVFWMSLVVSVVLYIAVFFGAPAIAGFYGMPQLCWPLRGLCTVLMFNALNSVQVAKVTRELKMKSIFNATIVAVLASAVIGVGSACAGMGLWALVLQQISYQIINCLVLFLQVDWHPRFVFDLSRARILFSFGWRLLLSGLIDQGYQSLSDLIVGKQFSSTELGLVSQGKKYPLAIGSMLDGAIQPVMLSAVSHVQDDVASVKKLVRRALKTSTFLIVPTMVAFACCAPTLVPLLLGPQWSSSVWFMQLYCLVYALLPIHTSNLQALNGMGRSDLFLKLEIIKKGYGLVALLICAFLFKDVKLLVASYLVTGIISTFVNAGPNKKIIGYSYLEQIKDIMPSFAFAFVASIPAAGVGMFAISSLAIVALQCVVFSAVYLGLAALFRLEAFTYLLNTLKGLTAKA